MENQTRYDLNAAVENWRNELAAQPNLASDDRRELETHLRDAIAGFRQRGLNDEESFWLARRRVGQPLELGEEFIKAEPAKIWRERLFWIAIALFTMQLWESINQLSWTMFPNFFSVFGSGSIINVSSIIFRQTIFYAPIIWIATSLALGRINKKSVVLNFLFSSRLCFVVIATAVFLAVHFLQTYESVHSFPNIPRQMIHNQWMLFFPNLTAPCVLIGLIAWLMPPQNRKTPKRA